MREGLDHWPFVIAAYGLTVLGTMALVLWTRRAMYRAEAWRERDRSE
jgi:hypothetical protein